MVFNAIFNNISAISLRENIYKYLHVQWLTCFSANLASSLAKGCDSGPTSLHPWRI